MSNDMMYQAAMHYYNEGLCVIPIFYRDKKPALPEWKRYQRKRSTNSEIIEWFGNGHQYNIGIVHGPVSGNFVSVDIDHDSGAFDQIMIKFPKLFKGRIEQSGSRAGYHIPIRLDKLPNFAGKGNRTWETKTGVVNIRVRDCQTVVPPSIHPSGHRYRFIQKGALNHASNLDDFIDWLNHNDVSQKPAPEHIRVRRPVQPAQSGSLLEAVQLAWPDVITVFREFGIVSQIKTEKNHEIRILGHGGLLVTADKQCWYCFRDETGGSIIEAWAWLKHGPDFDTKSNFRSLLLDMASTAGIDTVKFFKPGDEQQNTDSSPCDQNYWSRQFVGFWERAR